MAKKTDQAKAASAADTKEQTVATSADQALATAADTAVQGDAPASPAPATTADAKEQTVATSADQELETAADTAVQLDAPADPAPATELENPSGAIIEPEILGAADLAHESVDANPRAGTTSVQNAVDWNDAKRAKPQDDDFAGQGLDTSVYGKDASA